MTPLQEVSHQEWLENKAHKRMYDLCYSVLELVEDVRKNTIYDMVQVSEIENLNSFGVMEALANEILLIRELMNEDG